MGYIRDRRWHCTRATLRDGHVKTRVVAAIAVGLVGVVGFTAPAQAAQPAEQACLGEFFSTAAQQSGRGFGQTVAAFAQNPVLGNFGEGIQVLQAGEAALFPEVCNSD